MLSLVIDRGFGDSCWLPVYQACSNNSNSSNFLEATGQYIRPFRVMWIMVEKRSFCKFHIDTENESERRNLIAVYL